MTGLTVWTKTHGQRWRLDLSGDHLARSGALVAPAGGCAAAFAVELAADPNRMTGADVIELAELVAGPVPDHTHRRRHAA